MGGACGLLLLEFAVRAWRGLPLIPRTNILRGWADLLAIHTTNRYDALTGWILRPSLKYEGGFTTDPLGFRQNGSVPRRWEPGRGILAAGDSFTAGSGVRDEETWPAALERILDVPVINAGVGGWGADQIVLQAERIHHQFQPRCVVMALLSDDIVRPGYRVYWRGFKPWFTIEDGRLVPHDIPVPLVRNRPLGIARSILGWSAIADWIFGTTAPRWWHQDEEDHRTTGEDAPAITCLLLERLSFPTLLVILWGGSEIAHWPERPDHVMRVLEKAAALGLPTLDLWDELKAHPDLKSLYLMEGEDVYGHMSPAGNTLVAASIARALQNAALIEIAPEAVQA